MNNTTKFLAIAATTLALGLGSAAIAKPDSAFDRASRARSGGAPQVGNLQVGNRDGGPRGEARGERGPRGSERGPGKNSLMRPFWEVEGLTEEVGLTEDAVADLQSSYDATQALLEETEGSVREAAQALREVLEVDSPDITLVNAAIDEMSAATTEKKKILTGHRVVVKNVLTEEQEEAVKDYLRDHAREMRDEIRDSMRDLRDLVQGIVEDGDVTEEESLQIDAFIADLPTEVQDRVREGIDRRIERLLSGEGPEGASEREGRRGPEARGGGDDFTDKRGARVRRPAPSEREGDFEIGLPLLPTR